MSKTIQETLKAELLNHITSQNCEKFQSFFLQLSGSDVDKKLIVDHSFRDVLQQLITNGSSTATYCSLLDFAVFSVKQEICSPSTLFVMLSDLFDMVTLDDCDDVFCYVEEKVETWKCDVFYNAGKNYLLRMCNDLLRRISKSKSTVFCGRIQLFLARLFPLEEKSGLNLMSHFNLENVTVYNTSVDSLPTHNKRTDVDMECDGDSVKKPIDYNLYRKFWSLQDYFRRPTQCYDKVAWRTFVDHAEGVFNCFESYKLEDVKVPFNENAGPQSFFAKYLTSDKLLNLQLSDSNFRRNVLLQFLILFQYLNSHVKFKLAGHVLSDEQTTWLKNGNERVFKILSETPPDGPQFGQVIEHILNREDNWNAWKNESCSSYIRKKPDLKNKSPLLSKRRKRSIADELRMNHKIMRLGNPELTKLWNLNPDNFAACKSKNRNVMANFDEFFGEAIEQLDPAAGIEDQYKLINDPIFAWKALRLLASKSPHFFAQHQGNVASNPMKTTAQYLEQIVGKHAKDIMAINNSKNVSTDEMNVENECNATIVKKEPDLNEGDNSSTDQEQASFEQVEELMVLIGNDWKVLAACLDFSEERMKHYEEGGLSSEQITLDIMKSHKDHIYTVTPEKIESVLQKMEETA